MLVSDAKAFLGQHVILTYRERSGHEVDRAAEVFDVNFVALLGPCLITDLGEIRLDRIVKCVRQRERKAA